MHTKGTSLGTVRGCERSYCALELRAAVKIQGKVILEFRRAKRPLPLYSFFTCPLWARRQARRLHSLSLQDRASTRYSDLAPLPSTPSLIVSTVSIPNILHSWTLLSSGCRSSTKHLTTFTGSKKARSKKFFKKSFSTTLISEHSHEYIYCFRLFIHYILNSGNYSDCCLKTATCRSIGTVTLPEASKRTWRDGRDKNKRCNARKKNLYYHHHFFYYYIIHRLTTAFTLCLNYPWKLFLFYSLSYNLRNNTLLSFFYHALIIRCFSLSFLLFHFGLFFLLFISFFRSVLFFVFFFLLIVTFFLQIEALVVFFIFLLSVRRWKVLNVLGGSCKNLATCRKFGGGGFRSRDNVDRWKS